MKEQQHILTDRQLAAIGLVLAAIIVGLAVVVTLF